VFIYLLWSENRQEKIKGDAKAVSILALSQVLETELMKFQREIQVIRSDV